MAKAALQKTLENIKQELQNSSTAYRKLVSDRKGHSVRISSAKIITQVKRELENRAGYEKNKLPGSIMDIIDTEVPVMVAGMYDDFKNYNTDTKFSEVKQLHGNRSDFTFLIAAKPNRTANIFNAIRKIKQQNQRVLMRKLRAAIRKLNKGGQRKEQIRQLGRNFLDIGHQEGSSVAEQRKLAAEKALYEFGMNNTQSPLVGKFLKEIQGDIDLKLTRKTRKNADVLQVELESKHLNRKRGGSEEKKLAADLARDLEIINERLGGEKWAGQEGSDSKLSKARKMVLNPYAKVAKRSKNVKTNIKLEKVKKSASPPVKTKSKKTKNTVGPRLIDREVVPTGQGEREQRKSFFSFIALINQKLPRTVEKNMRAPALESRTGRLARSVQVKDVIETKKGFPSFGYTYEKDPYEVFEVGRGKSPWATPDRDPRKLIDRSIREIAAEMALGRFYTRRL